MSVQISKESNQLIEMDNDKKALLKRTICKGSTDDEFDLFCQVCKHTGLDPIIKQIYPVKRWDSKEKREIMSIQTSIDGFRLIAERSSRYCPGRESTYQYDKNGKIISSTAYVKKLTMDGTWHEIASTAFFEEYAQKNKEGEVTSFWKRMPHVMISKCAESLALRKAFPAELSGIYTQEEMSQADDEPKKFNKVEPIQSKTKELETIEMEVSQKMDPISDDQFDALIKLFGEDKEAIQKVCNHYGIASIDDLPSDKFDIVVHSYTIKKSKGKSDETRVA